MVKKLTQEAKWLILLACILCIGLPTTTNATHIVGGSLTYVHNGGSNYTVTLKLYRDCGPGTAGLPNNVTISVRGNNGATFNPSRDINMALSQVTPVPPNLDPCAIPPNPLPCVEEGLYTATVNNLPPNGGGYHMYYQIIARNLTIVNINAAGNNIGESFYAYIPGPNSIWLEDFALADGTGVDNGATAWSVNNGATAPNSADVNGGQFRVQGANNSTAQWASQIIPIGAFPGGVDMSASISETGNFENSDNITVSYSVDGGPITQFATNGFFQNDFGGAIATQTGIVGTNLQIFVDAVYGGNSPNNERYFIDDVSVFGSNVASNSNPEFTLLPPLFLCVNEPFTFDHSATDLDGDSLVYEFYTPYDGDNGAGPLDPTFPGNIATFTPVVFLPGFGVNNPLGGPPLTLDPNTGLMAGTPTILGQFVLGVKVIEYRNGVYLSETLRDFQFNIVNCPPPLLPIAGNDIIVNDGCIDTLLASGYIENTVTWTSIFPGAQGTYDGYLSCTAGCLDPIVTATGTPPPFVDYIICGTAQACGNAYICDTVRATFNPSLAVTIVPQNPTLCFGQTSTTLTAQGSGGTPPYTYLWNNINPSQTNIVGAGTYTVELSDSSGCPPVYATVVVNAFNVPIAADAGVDDTVCITNPIANLNGTIAGATGGQWSGGGGTFSPNDSTLTNVFYTPTAAEVNNGFVDLYLNSTGNAGCPPDADTVRIFFLGFIGTPTTTTTDVTCFGAADGTATVTITGGIPPFTYSWNSNPNQTGATATNLDPGSYVVTITNGIGCTTTETVTISQAPPLAISSTSVDVSCNGGTDGSVTAAGVQGTAPYTYLWAPGGQTTAAITNQPAGIYTITVTDANGCVETLNDTVFEPDVITINTTQVDVSCNGGTDGSATATATGGTAPYTYNWTPTGGTSANATGLAAGTYTVTVTDNNGCTQTADVIITEPAPLALTTTGTDETCDYADDGTVSVTVTGGTANYSYLWTPGGFTTSAVTGLTAGTYTVTVTDANGCVENDFVTITEPTPITLNMTTIDVDCNGGATGTASATVSGGTPNYTYLWTPGGQTTATINNLTAGVYDVTVTDANGCFQNAGVTIQEPAQPLSAGGTVTNVSCNFGTDGTAGATPTGGTAPYTYLWLPGGQTTQNISGQAAGTFTVTVTDANGCTDVATLTINEPPVLSIAFAMTSTSCNGGADGSATATVSGGTPGYTYSWSPSGSTSAVASSLSAGTHVLTITDILGCVHVDSVVVTEPTAVIATATGTDETCDYLNDGTATVTGSGGTPGYTYLWTPGGFTTATVTGLASGTYAVDVTDLNGCVATTTITIAQPAPIAINFTSQINVSCNGGADGFVTATVTGGTPNYSYLWTPGGSTSNSVAGLGAGTYTVDVTDNNGCTASNSVIITEPTPVTVAPSMTPVSCNAGADGTVTANGSGGVAPYTYNWMPGNYASQTVTNLPAGTYTVTATDANGCTATNTVAVTEPGIISLNVTTVNSNCGFADGSATVNVVSGGTAPFTYSWNPGGQTTTTATGLIAGQYTVTVTDANGCTATASGNVNDNAAPTLTISATTNVSCFGGTDGSATVSVVGGVGPFTYLWAPSGQTTPTAVNLPAGAHTVTVTASNGCIATVTTSPNITQPPAIFGTVSTTAVNCTGGNDGTATVTALGGTPGYTYLWMPMGGTGTTVTGLSAGLDSVQITDVNGCTEVIVFTVTEPTTALSVGVSQTNVSCFGGNDGSAGAIASGGTPPYTYSWAPGGLNGQNIGNLSIGTYTVTVVDGNGCTATNSVTITEPTQLTLAPANSNSTCGFANGTASVVASGGTGAYTYSWSPQGGTNATATNLPAGNYQVAVTDANGCVAAVNITVTNVPGPSATISGVTFVSCFGGTDGTATVNVTGGTGPFTYAWSPSGATTATATGLASGIHTVVVTDANGCQTSAISPYIIQPWPIVLSLTTTDVSCAGGNDGFAQVGANGGTPGYTVLWMPGGSNGISVNNLTAGVDSVMVTDANGCTETVTFTINEPTALTSTITASSNVSCFGGNNGFATVTAAGGSPFYSYSWAPYGGSNPTATGLIAGTYTVTVTDFEGCTSTSNVTITEPAAVLEATATSTPVSCAGGADGSATANPTGGTAPYTYTWLPSGGSNQTATGLAAGVYLVQIVDANGCQTNATIAVPEPPAITGNLVVVDPSCGLSNGSITTAISGGTPPYTYAWAPGGATTANLTGLAPGTYFVDVTDAAGCILSLQATLVNIPAATVTIASTIATSCFGGNDGTATANITGGTLPYSISWAPYGGNFATATGLSAGTYTVTAIDGSGCISTAQAVITEPQPITINVAANTGVSCNGGSDASITLTVSGGTAPYTYSWAPVAGNAATINNLPAGTYDCTVTDANGCVQTTSVIVTEPTTLITTIGLTANPSCSGMTDGQAGVIASGGTPPYTYLWNGGQTGSTATNLGGGAYSVTVTDANGCTSTENLTLIDPAPVVTLAGPNDTICLGQSATLTATATGGIGTYSFAWQPVGVVNAGTLTPSPTVNSTYTVAAYDANGCPGNVDTVDVIVYNLTQANIDAGATVPIICPGQEINVWVNTTGVNDPLTYTWNNGVPNGPGPHAVTPVLDTTWFVVTVANTCGLSVQDSVQVIFAPPPTINVWASADTACAPAVIQFMDSSVTGNPADQIHQWFWDFGDGNSSQLQDPVHVYDDPGTYTVTLTVITGNGCVNDNIGTPLTVHVYPYPEALFTVNQTEFNLPMDWLITDNQSTGATDYIWNFGDGNSSTEENPEYLYNSIGEYAIQLIAYNDFGCADTAEIVVNTSADIIWPNAFTPGEDGSTGGYYDITSLDNDIFFPYTSGVVDYQLQIFNRWGELIFETSDINQGWDGYYRGVLSQQGVYVWKAHVRLNNGKEFNGIGDVTLLR